MSERSETPFRSLLPASDSQLLRERRAQLEQDRREALERREQELREQCSPLYSPEARILMWERLHGLTLPRSSSHNLLVVIAKATGLSAEAVAQVQQERRATRAPRAPELR
jgi:hypothetical protein